MTKKKSVSGYEDPMFSFGYIVETFGVLPESILTLQREGFLNSFGDGAYTASQIQACLRELKLHPEYALGLGFKMGSVKIVQVNGGRADKESGLIQKLDVQEIAAQIRIKGENKFYEDLKNY